MRNKIIQPTEAELIAYTSLFEKLQAFPRSERYFNQLHGTSLGLLKRFGEKRENSSFDRELDCDLEEKKILSLDYKKNFYQDWLGIWIGDVEENIEFLGLARKRLLFSYEPIALDMENNLDKIRIINYDN